jgi:hypothetical protein
MFRTFSGVLFSFLIAATLPAQEPAPSPDTPAPPAAAASPNLPGIRVLVSDPQPYDKVITKDAKSAKGIFTVHQVKDRYYYEIPKDELDKEFLLNVRVSKTTVGVGYGGDQMSDLVVRWELNGNKVHLRDVNYSVTADPNTPIALAVKAANNDAILMTFAVAAFAKDGAPVIDVSRLFTSDVPEFNVRQQLNATTMDASRSYIERITPYPGNVEAESTLTYTRAQLPVGGAVTAAAARGMRPGSASIVLHYSMVKLPEKPMMPRLFDERVGYFTTSTLDYSREEHRAPRVRYIARWRLEKKDPAAAVSDPVKPIVYYIDAATPMKWREWLRKGVESWQPAFEAAGFRNAIVAKMAPTHEEDPDFSPEDVRYSVIRWMPSTTENAVGPHISDPRTGEILNADIQFYHNVMNLQRDWYFLQAGPLDPRARKLPLPDDLMGRLLEFVVAHEIGHTLGFEHNMKASSLYPQDKVRDKDWVHKMGHTPSIMDYSRFNYVAQPEDGIDVEDLVPRVGPYDVFATRWGYTPIAEAKSPDEEKPTLNEWARAQDKTPWLRFSTAGAAGSDFGELTEAVGDADAIKSSAMGLKNLQRVAKMLMPATTARTGEPYEDLSELYGRMLGQWTLEMNHVAAIVGGFDSQTKYVGQEGRLFTPVAKDRQQLAMKFLADNAFATPRWAIDPEILRRIEPTGVLNRIRNAQSSVLSNLLSSPRFARLVEQQAVDGTSAYAPEDFLAAARRAVWRELDTDHVRIDAYRRNLQRAWLDLANTKVNSTTVIPAGLPPELAGLIGGSGDEKPFYRAELRTLSAQISAALDKVADRETRAHLEGARDQIARILDPRFNQGGNQAAPVIRLGFDGIAFAANSGQPDICWPDYVILPN